MVINHLEKLFVTNDAATILRELEVSDFFKKAKTCFGDVRNSVQFNIEEATYFRLYVKEFFCPNLKMYHTDFPNYEKLHYVQHVNNCNLIS